jgi:hypothetical protein
MTDNEKVVWIAALLLVHSSIVEAVPVTRTESSSINGSAPPFTFSFAPIASADSLLSISDGSITEPEGGTFSLAIDYVGGASQTLVSGTLTATSRTVFFTSFGPLSFTPGAINGLTFTGTGTAPFSPELFIPAGTVFTFDAAPGTGGGTVPEPSSLALLLSGGAAGLLNWRRRRLGTVHDATSE